LLDQTAGNSFNKKKKQHRLPVAKKQAQPKNKNAVIVECAFEPMGSHVAI
jgi:hypothetical protein